MRIRLRPYHPTYVVGYFGQGYHPPSSNSRGFNEIIAKIQADPDLEVELVEGYDDVCGHCERRVENAMGSIWGAAQSCPSSDDPAMVEGVKRANARVLADLGLHFGSVIKLRQLVPLLAARIPVLDDEMIGGPAFQERYDLGLEKLSRLYAVACTGASATADEA